MARKYQIYRLNCIPEFRLDVEEDHRFKILYGPSEAKWFFNDKQYGHKFYTDINEYNERISVFLSTIDEKIIVHEETYKTMDNLIKDGTANKLFEAIEGQVVCFTDLISSYPTIDFKGIYPSKFRKSPRGYHFTLSSPYPGSRQSYSKDYSVSDGQALKYLLHLYFLVQIKEMPLHGTNRDFSKINESYIRADILERSIQYGFLEIKKKTSFKIEFPIKWEHYEIKLNSLPRNPR